MTRGKTARQILEEQGLWEEYKQNNTYDPMARFDAAGIVPMTKDSEVKRVVLNRKQIKQETKDPKVMLVM